MSVDVPGEIAGRRGGHAPATKRTGAHWLVFLGTAVDGLRARPDLEGLAGVRPRRRARPCGSSATSSGSTFSQNSGALFGLFRDNALVFGIVSLVVVALIVGYHARAGRSLYLSLALGSAARRRASATWSTGCASATSSTSSTSGIGDLRFYTFNVGGLGDHAARSCCSSRAAHLPGPVRAWAIGRRMVDPALRAGCPAAARARTAPAAGWIATSPTRPGCRAATSRSSSPTAV